MIWALQLDLLGFGSKITPARIVQGICCLVRAFLEDEQVAISKCFILRELSPGSHLYPVLEVLGEFGPSLAEQTHAVIKGMDASCSLDKDSFDHEVAVFKLDPHPHIIKCLQIVENARLDFGRLAGKRYNLVVLPFLPTDLYECISRMRFTESTARFYLEQLLDAVEHLHKNDLAHLDIKPDNILLDDKYNLVLTDFGHTAEHSDAKGPKTFSKETTPGICPPEYYKNGEYNGIQMDMFAIGKLLYTMIIGIPPFKSAKNNDQYFRIILRNNWREFWGLARGWMKKRDLAREKLTDEFKYLVQSLLNLDPEKRFTIEQVRKSAWFENTKPCALDEIQRNLQLAGFFGM